MKKIDILTLFPEMFDGFLNSSIIKRAREKQQIEINTIDIRDFTNNKHRKVDDYPYGGGQGMVLMCQPVVDCIKSVRADNSTVILLSPQGKTLNQKLVRELVLNEHIILICGHYEGFDERILNYVDMELSIGDYVLTGGECAAMVVTDALTRLCDGVITEVSHQDESFENDLLEYPQYTKPQVYDGYEVPCVLYSGHHENVRKWRLEKSLEKTLLRRPDLLEKRKFNDEEAQVLKNLKKN